FFAAVDRAAVKRPDVAFDFAERSMKLILEDSRDEVAGVRHVGRNVVLGTRVEVFFRSRNRWRHSLVARAKPPPGGVVFARLGLAAQHVPAPLVDQLSERQKRDSLERPMHEKVDVRFLARRRFLVENAYF